MKFLPLHKIILISSQLLLAWALFPSTSQAQDVAGMTQREFGKNRVQFKDFDWRMKSSPNFEIYYYDFGSGIADYAILYAESEFQRIADALGHSPYNRTKLFIYNSITDLQQSNIGLNSENRGLGGQAEFVKPKIEIPFTGSLYEFKQELSYGIAQIFVIEMMYGGSIREMLQNSVLLNLPDWFMAGAAAYVAEGWTQEMDDFMRVMGDSRKIRRPGKLRGDQARLVGQSIWNFIAQKYGEKNISSILNLTRIIRNEETSIGTTLGMEYKQFIKEWRSFYKETALTANEKYQEIPYDYKLRKWNKQGRQYNDLKFSPDGKYIAYTEKKRGKYCVVVRDLTTKRKKRKVIFRGGFQLNAQRLNPDVPLIAWSDGHQVGIVYKKGGETEIRINKVDKKRPKKPTYKQRFKFFNQVTGFDLSADGKTFAISSDRTGAADVRVGQNDLVLYDTERQFLKRVTLSDLYDDTDPVFVGDADDVVIFSSNRPNDTIKIDPGNFRTIGGDYNLFIYNPSLSEDYFDQLTFDLGQETQPMMLDDQTVLYLSDENGVNNIYSIDLQDRQPEVLTNYLQDVRSYGAYKDDNKNLLATRAFFQRKRREEITVNEQFDFQPVKPGEDTERLQLLKARGFRATVVEEEEEPITPSDSLIQDTEQVEQPYDPNVVDTDDYQFDPEVVKEMQTTVQKVQKQSVSNRGPGENPRIRGVFPYEPRFTAESTVTTPFVDPLRGFGLLFEVDLSDLREDHRLRAGILGITDLRSSNYYLEFLFLPKRIDWGFRYDRKSIYLDQESLVHRYALNKFAATAAYPFTNSTRLSASVGYMDTKFVNIGNLPAPNELNRYAHTRLEFIYDNAIVMGLNMVSGTRIRVRYDNNVDISGDGSSSFDNIYVDIRNYQPIDRDIVFATRFSFGAFGGEAPKQYALGGMDNWIGGQIGSSGENDPFITAPNQNNSDLLFTDFATNLRGYDYNRLSGTNFLVFNAEFRIPLIKYIFQNSISSNFFRNLQFTAFGDIGSAWTDTPPWERQNEVNTTSQSNQTFDIITNNFKNPFLASYGVGARTLFLGYYLKFDVAWAVEDYIVADTPSFYFTLGYDF
ncbi:MAG: hypothetical protein ACFB0B_13065 [Thermonemataceae bacterium]